MKASEFKALDPLAGALDERCDRWFASPEFAALKEALVRAAATLPPSYSMSVDVELRVFDSARERGGLSLLRTGLSASGEGELYRTAGDSTAHRYVVGGEICELPDGRCPRCWGDWDFKVRQPTCPQCRYSLGKEVKLLLDRDLCPHCERGSISAENPTCGECGFRVDPSFVNWG